MRKVVRKMFFAWNEEKEKKFLEDMALKGYRLIKVNLGKYTFEKDKPKKLIYQFDFRGYDKMSEENYLQIYEDAGWDCVYKYGSWYYFCKEWSEDEVDLSLFNDNESKRKKYQRLMFFLMITGFPLYYQTLIFFPNMSESKLEFPSFYFFFRIFALILTGLHIFAVIKILLKYKKLQNKLKE
ncbi:DUF2812 domain-containing protein [Abyssisolibacter fermentans]|uniref:DUF2812 domain-containing protein n=1 Tax=Abyssisolibacter fermentans TaxID=1766203 RepID=UPI00082CE4C4|nr:DUF2812 domain-containing protein [Abyssisolibacter fermentans]